MDVFSNSKPVSRADRRRAKEVQMGKAGVFAVVQASESPIQTLYRRGTSKY